MHKITKIEKQTKRDRYNIYLGGVYGFSVSSRILVDYSLGENQGLTDKQIEEIKNADEESKAYNRAILILSYRANTEGEIKTKASQYSFDSIALKKGVDKETINSLMLDKDETQELENALKHAERVIKKYEKSDIQTQKTKLYENLTRKGFSYDIFKQVVRDLGIW